LDMSEITEEAFERCGLELRTGYDARTARRSLNLLFAEWANRGLNLWTIEQVIRRDGDDISVSRINREDYLNIPTKTTQGRPTQYYVNRLITPTVTVWPSPENSTDQLIYYRVKRLDDSDAATNNAQVPFRFLPCLVAGLAYHISVKRAPDRIGILKNIYEEEFQRAASEDGERTALRLVPTYTSLRL
jgi:hypothetical protein